MLHSDPGYPKGCTSTASGNAFKAELRKLSDAELLEWWRTWENRQREHPPLTPNAGFVAGEWPQLVFLREERERRKYGRVFDENAITIRRQWTTNRGDFARLVRDKYQQDEKRSALQRKFEDLKDAAYKLFEQWEFPADWDWTKERCYQYVKQLR